MSDGLGHYGKIGQDDTNVPLVGVPETMAAASAVPVIEVVSPATLPGGYKIDVQVNGRIVKVTVPPGGVAEGQRFTAPMEELNVQVGGSAPSSPSSTGSGGGGKINVPVGGWRDHFFCDLCKHGPLHSSVWVSCCTAGAAAGQVASRLGLDFLGRPTTDVHARTSTWPITLGITTMYLLIRIGFMFIMTMEMADTEDEMGVVHEEEVDDSFFEFAVLRKLDIWLYYIFSVYVLYNVRSYVRSRYAIPEHELCAPNTEDFLASCLCPHFTAAQLLRHTTDYETYAGTFCTATGLPQHVDAVVV